MDKRQQQLLQYLPDFNQQYFSSISVPQNHLCGMFAEYAISSDVKPRVWIDI